MPSLPTATDEHSLAAAKASCTFANKSLHETNADALLRKGQDPIRRAPPAAAVLGNSAADVVRIGLAGLSG
jgi:hypothetical protein